MRGLEMALLHAERGREVFPYRRAPQPDGHAKKIPLVKWTEAATADLDGVRALWRGKSLRPAGWRLPEGLVVVDVDHEGLFPDDELDLPETASQRTQRGAHYLYRTDGRPIPQVNRQERGFDTRCGGRGWVALYAEDSFDGQVADAPEWLYDLATAESNPITDEPISSRSEILSLAGRLRWAGLTGDEINDVLIGRLEDGRIHSADEADPWTEDHLARIASDYGQKPIGGHDYHEDTPIRVNIRGRGLTGGLR